MYLEWNQLTPNQMMAVLWHGGSMTGYPSEAIASIENDYNNYRAKQAEIERIRKETERLQKQNELNSEVSKQDLEKQRRTDEANANSDSRATTGNNKSMLSGLTGFAKIRRKVLGSVGEVGSTDEKLGG